MHRRTKEELPTIATPTSCSSSPHHRIGSIRGSSTKELPRTSWFLISCFLLSSSLFLHVLLWFFPFPNHPFPNEESLQRQIRQLQEQLQQQQSCHQSSLVNNNDNNDNDQTSLMETCRNVFHARGQGGLGEFTIQHVQEQCQDALVYDVCRDLQTFTGLSTRELQRRLQRQGRFHVEGEHDFWNPTTTTELAWYYATSVDYLFANALHPVFVSRVKVVAKSEYEPILDYSGGVGNNILYLASQGLKCHYFGIGMIEYQFAQYRIQQRGLQEHVTFRLPYSAQTKYEFDPIQSALPRDGSLGAILAMDVLEHIPHYHVVVKAMVDSLRVGGVLVEKTPFDPIPAPQSHNQNNNMHVVEDVRVHLSDGGINMTMAMGPRMQRKSNGVWIKIAN